MTTVIRDPQDSHLKIEDVKIATLARKYGTPLYVYSHGRLIENHRRIQEAFAPVAPLIA